MANLDPWLWLGGSLLLAVVAAQASWWLWRLERSHAWLEPLSSWPFLPVLIEVGRLLYYVGLPFAALIWGQDAVVGRLLGLQPLVFAAGQAPNWTDWARDAAWTGGLAVTAWAVLAIGWLTVRSAPGSAQPSSADLPGWKLLWEAVFHQAHWAFYRNAPLVALGPYGGVWAGLGLVALEAGLNPWRWADLGDAERAPATFVQAGLAMLSAVLYLKTANLWLAVLAHWGVAWGLAAWVRAFPLPRHRSVDTQAGLEGAS